MYIFSNERKTQMKPNNLIEWDNRLPFFKIHDLKNGRNLYSALNTIHSGNTSFLETYSD